MVSCWTVCSRQHESLCCWRSACRQLQLQPPARRLSEATNGVRGWATWTFFSASAALSEGALSDIAAEALKRDNVLLAVHRLATNDRCAAKVRCSRESTVLLQLTACCDSWR